MKMHQVLGLTALISLFGCTQTSVIEQAKLLGNSPFSEKAWAAADQQQRGQMVASFLSQHSPESLSVNEVKKLLGPPTGYYDYDENAAYFVGPQSVQSKYGKGYLLAFVADKASGKIVSVKIIPAPHAQ